MDMIKQELNDNKDINFNNNFLDLSRIKTELEDVKQILVLYQF